MHYPAFRQKGWPIGSGMVESAQKNVVEARFKGAGMHWQRKNVNPLLALRNAVCNDRWQEMWQKAVLHYRKQQALQRSVRVEQRTPAFLSVGGASSQESSPAQSAIVSGQIAPLAPSLPVSEAEAPPVPEASQPSSCRLSSRRKQLTSRNRVKYSHQKVSERSGEVCSCGTPLARFKGHRTTQYCSDRCRMRAYRKRQTPVQPLSAPAAPLAPAQHRRIRAAVLSTKRISVSSLRSGGVRGETCHFCGTRLSQLPGGRLREYCSGRCRQRAHCQRQRRV